MDELAKIRRVLGRLNPEAPHDVVLVLDATTGQNALSQIKISRNRQCLRPRHDQIGRQRARRYRVAAAKPFGLPIHAIGVGETINDLRPFNAQDLARAISSGAQ